MLEDYWLPRREGGRGTEISTLPGGENLGELADVEYFKTKLYKSLNVPPSRLEQDTGFILGRAEEISRDEVKFTRYIERLRARFQILFDDILEKQLILKGIISSNDWMTITDHITYEWESDSHFKELKDAQMMKERLEMVSTNMGFSEDIIGKFFSLNFVRKNILKLSQEQIDEMEKEIELEKGTGGGTGELDWEIGAESHDPKKDGKPDLKVISG
jgi:hypothetical protein